MEEQISQEHKFESAAETQTPEAESVQSPQNENQNTEQKKSDENLKRKLLLADAIALAFVQFTALIFLLTGVVPMFGANFPVWRIISVIADLIESVRFFSWYKIFAPALILIAYIVALCLVIGNTVKTAKSLKLYISSRKEVDLSIISRRAFSTIVFIFALIAFSNSFYKNDVNAIEIITLVLTGIAYLYHRATICYVNFKKPDFVELICSTAFYAGIYVIVAVIFCLFNENVFRETGNVFNAIVHDGGDISTKIIFDGFVLPVLYMIMLLSVMQLCAGCLNNDISGGKALAGWISTIVPLVATMLFGCLIPTKFKEFAFINLWLSIRSVIFPLFILTATLWVMMSILKKPRQSV